MKPAKVCDYLSGKQLVGEASDALVDACKEDRDGLSRARYETRDGLWYPLPESSDGQIVYVDA